MSLVFSYMNIQLIYYVVPCKIIQFNKFNNLVIYILLNFIYYLIKIYQVLYQKFGHFTFRTNFNNLNITN